MVRTLIIATISFMTSDDYGTGSVRNSDAVKRKYALESLQYNLNKPLFKELFKRQIAELSKTRI